MFLKLGAASSGERLPSGIGAEKTVLATHQSELHAITQTIQVWKERQSWRAQIAATNTVLTAALCSPLQQPQPCGTTNGGESQPRLLSRGGDAERSGLTREGAEPRMEHYIHLLFSFLEFSFSSTWVNLHQSHSACSTSKFLPVLSYLFILAVLETLEYGKSSCAVVLCEIPCSQRSDTGLDLGFDLHKSKTCLFLKDSILCPFLHLRIWACRVSFAICGLIDGRSACVGLLKHHS